MAKNNIQKFAAVFFKPSGNPYARLSAVDDVDEHAGAAPTDARKRSLKKRPGPAPAGAPADELSVTSGKVIEILSHYLPTAARARDRKVLVDVSEEFVSRLNELTPHQRQHAVDQLARMAPRGGRQLEAARTTLDTLQTALDRLLVDARSQ